MGGRLLYSGIYREDGGELLFWRFMGFFSLNNAMLIGPAERSQIVVK